MVEKIDGDGCWAWNMLRSFMMIQLYLKPRKRQRLGRDASPLTPRMLSIVVQYRCEQVPGSLQSLVPKAQSVIVVEDIFVPLNSGGGHLNFGLLCSLFFMRMGCS